MSELDPVPPPTSTTTPSVTEFQSKAGNYENQISQSKASRTITFEDVHGRRVETAFHRRVEARQATSVGWLPVPREKITLRFKRHLEGGVDHIYGFAFIRIRYVFAQIGTRFVDLIGTGIGT